MHDHLAVGKFVALADVGVLHFLAVALGYPLVADARAIGVADLTEGYVVLLGRGVQLHRDADEAK